VDEVGWDWLKVVGGGQGWTGHVGGGLRCGVCFLLVAGRLRAAFGGVGNDVRGWCGLWRCLGSIVDGKGGDVVFAVGYREAVRGRVVGR
jgi:hypothetical protein